MKMNKKITVQIGKVLWLQRHQAVQISANNWSKSVVWEVL